MKIISLNTWGGRVHEKLLKFFDDNQDVDIFCLQEIYNGANIEKMDPEFLQDAFNLYSDIKDRLPDHVGYFRPHIEDWYGLAIFLRKEIKIRSEGDISIYDIEYTGAGNHPRNLHYVELENNSDVVTVANVHGLWNGKGKTDTEERILQSKKIKEFMDSVGGRKILCGDFNLLPDTESIKILEDGMKNLITEYGVDSTRTSLYTKPEKYADYIFTSYDIKIVDFKVLSDEVSDHSALYLEFN